MTARDHNLLLDSTSPRERRNTVATVAVSIVLTFITYVLGSVTALWLILDAFDVHLDLVRLLEATIGLVLVLLLAAGPKELR